MNQDGQQQFESEFDKHMREMFVAYVDKFMMKGNNRTTIIFRFNGKHTTVLAIPITSNEACFEREAKRHDWVDKSFPTIEKKRGMVEFLFKQFPELKTADIWKDVGIETPTGFTCSMADFAGLGTNQLQKIRSILKHNYNIDLNYSGIILDQVDEEIGMDYFEIMADEFINEKKDKEDEICPYYTVNVKNEVCSEIDMYILKKVLNEDTKSLNLNYTAPSNENGMTVLFGGDHGKGAFRMHCKIHLHSPKERKNKKKLSYQCPMIQIAYICYRIQL